MSETAPTILVLDDEALIGMELEALLQDAGYRVAGPAIDVEEGLALIEAETIDGAVLDLNLNGERSDPVADRLAELDIPFTYLTGHADAVIDERHRHAPIISKPFDDRRLLRTLAEMSAPKRAGGTPS
jgi:DNA-binding NtrC family response regulator